MENRSKAGQDYSTDDNITSFITDLDADDTADDMDEYDSYISKAYPDHNENEAEAYISADKGDDSYDVHHISDDEPNGKITDQPVTSDKSDDAAVPGYSSDISYVHTAGSSDTPDDISDTEGGDNGDNTDTSDTRHNTGKSITAAHSNGKRMSGGRRLRKDSYALVILRILNSMGPARRKDLNIYLLSYFSKQTAVRIWHDLASRGFVTLYKDRAGQLTARITRTGRIYLADNAPDQKFLDTWKMNDDPDFISSPSAAVYNRGMTLSTVQIMFMSCDAAVLPEDKPSCADLFMAMCPETTKEKLIEARRRAEQSVSGSNGSSENGDDESADDKNDDKEDSRKNKTVYRHCTHQEMTEILERGIFYTASEFRDALKELHYGDSTAVAGSRFYGVWFSSDRYYIVYAAVSSRRIRLAKAVESRLVDMVYAFAAEITDFRSVRQLPFHFGKEMNYGKNCIVITIGSGTIKSMATGTVYGKNNYGAVNDYLRDNGVNVRTLPAVPTGLFTSDKTENVSGKKGRPARAQLLLQHHNELFNKVYAVESNNIGATSLMYILKTSPEQYREEYLRFASVPPFDGKVRIPPEEKTYEFCYYITLNNNGPDNKGTPMRIVYVPCYDINTITDMRIGYHEKNERFAIITRPELAGIISACIGGECLFLHESNGRMVMIPDVPVYDRNGFTAEQAEAKRKTIEKNYSEKLMEEEIREKIRNLQQEKSGIPPEQRAERRKINDEIRALKAELPDKRKNRGINVQTVLPLEMHAEIKKIAEEQGNTISYVIRGMVESALKNRNDNPDSRND